MSIPLVVTFFLLLGVGACGLVATLVSWDMVEEINKKLPESEQFDPIAVWSPGKRGRLFSEYRRLYPDGKHRRQILYLSVTIAVLLMAALYVFSEGPHL